MEVQAVNGSKLQTFDLIEPVNIFELFPIKTLLCLHSNDLFNILDARNEF